jgi:uncharacterized repeat protein (TIGR01451 family)
MTARFTDDPDCPVDARTILTYSLSTNPASPWYADQTRMFSNKQWVDERYCESEILADPNLTVKQISNAPEADVAVTQTDSPDPVFAGERLVYTITVSNNGPDTATGLTLADVLPKSVRVSSVRATQGSCRSTRKSVSCNVAELPNGDSMTVTITVRPTRKGLIRNTVSVTSAAPADPNAANNTHTETTDVKP